MDEYQNHLSRRYYPTQSSTPKYPPCYPSPRLSENKAIGVADAAVKAPNDETPQSTGENTNGSHSPLLAKASSSHSTSYHNVTSASASDSSFYETLRMEAASFCPLCGFQIVQANNSSSNTRDFGSELQTAVALASVANVNTNATPRLENFNDDMPPSSWLRSFVVHQQEHLLNGYHPTDSSGFFAFPDNTDQSTRPFHLDTEHTKLPSGTCWVCLQAANKAAKELQVEEDRMLAASLSKIILEEQQDHSREFYSPPRHHHHHNHHRNDTSNSSDEGNYNTNTTHSQIVSPYGYHGRQLETGTNNMSQYRHHGLREEWQEERHMSIAAAPTQDRNCEQSNPTACKRNSLTDQDCNIHQGENNATANEDSRVYIGEYNVLGQRHGSRGELIWNSGDRYVGTFKNGMQSGQGAFFFRDGKTNNIWASYFAP